MTSGKQWVNAMLGTLYKRNGHLNKALDMLQQGKEEAEAKKDELGVMNSLHALIDLFLYWGIPEYANLYATEAIEVEKSMTKKNPMVSAQTYINKGRALMQLGETDSVSACVEHARELCEGLSYNSGRVDVDLLNGALLTKIGGDSLSKGVAELERVTREGTELNRARAYHQLAQTYLANENGTKAEEMLDSMYGLLTKKESPMCIRIEYDAILNHYINSKKTGKVEQYTKLMLQEQQMFNEKRLKYNLVENIVDLQTEQKRQELRISELKHANKNLWIVVCIVISAALVCGVIAYLIRLKKNHAKQMKQVDEKLSTLMKQIEEMNAEGDVKTHEMRNFLESKDNRQMLETLTPTILKDEGEGKFRAYFEILYPVFLPRLREKVATITPREELLSMLIVLKQDNKRIAELLGIAPRSVLMLRHRYRQKIGMLTEFSLEDFIDEILKSKSK